MSVPQIRSAEEQLLATLKQATLALDAVGTSELATALKDLERAAFEAKVRLSAAADKARSVVSSLSADASLIASTLQAELFGPAKPAETKPVPQIPDAQHQQPEASADEDEKQVQLPDARRVVRQELQAWSSGEGVEITTGTSAPPSGEKGETADAESGAPDSRQDERHAPARVPAANGRQTRRPRS